MPARSPTLPSSSRTRSGSHPTTWPASGRGCASSPPPSPVPPGPLTMPLHESEQGALPMNLTYAKAPQRRADDPFEVVERKGHGHPDTLADALGEHLSRAYARHTLKEFGLVLHHQFDKVGIMGGRVHVAFGEAACWSRSGSCSTAGRRCRLRAPRSPS